MKSVDAMKKDMLGKFPTEDEVRSHWRADGEPPLVSLVSISYQHAPFIVDTLRGIVEQRTEFPFEIICYDDFSTDGTRDILHAFAERYPELVTLVLPESNQFSRGRKPYFEDVVPRCKGQFLARIECDDYWSDSLKIQKQVSFLLHNPDYVFATHDMWTIDEQGASLRKDWLPDFWKEDFSAQELRFGWCTPTTQTMLYRNIVHEVPEELRKTPSGDYFFGSMLGQYGKGKYLSDIGPSMYRQHGNGRFSPLSPDAKTDVQAQVLFFLYLYHKRRDMPHEAWLYKIRYLERSLRNISLRDLIRVLRIRFFRTNPKSALSSRKRVTDLFE